jgi:hypothetical protein
VRNILVLLGVMAIAAFGGLAMTREMVAGAPPFGRVTVDAWTVWPRIGTPDIDPYARAILARTGELPMAPAEGLLFRAETTSDGRMLDGRCRITISGMMPAARAWTLTLYGPDGRTVPNQAERFGFTSQDVLRQGDGRIEIVAAAQVQPGNWLPTSNAPRVVLMLRLYDTPVTITDRAPRELALPRIMQGACP